MQYNESEYNLDSYNLTNYTSTLTESIAPSDATVAKSISVVKTDSQAAADALSDGVSLAAMLDTVTILQRAHTPFSYNNGRYNDYTYNARFDEDEVLLVATKALLDDIASSDALQPFAIYKVLSDTISDSDSLSFAFDFSLTDFVFFAENFRIEITKKALFATIRMNDWVGFKHRPFTEYWGN